MSSYISAELRRLVATRADFLCEYCLIHEDDTYFGCQVDHIISEKHGGMTDAENLAYACAFRNRSKGTDIGSLTDSSRVFCRFFNPRGDWWSDHFFLEPEFIRTRSDIGEITARILGFNQPDRCQERAELRAVGRYPVAAAIKRLAHRA